MQDQLGELGTVVLRQLELGLFAVLVGELGDAALDHVAADGVGVLTEGRDQAFMNGPLDGVNVRDARRDVLRLDDQAGQIRQWRGVALVRLLRKLAFVEFVNEQHGVLLISSATRGRTGERSLRRPPLLSAGQPLFGPNGRYPAQASPLAKRAFRSIPSQPPPCPPRRGGKLKAVSSPCARETRRAGHAGSPTPRPAPAS